MDWKKIVSAVAPALGTALGGPLAGLAVSTIGDALVGKPTVADGEIVAALTAGGPDALARLREADRQFAARMRELDIDLERLHQADRASARDREARTSDRWTPRILAGVILGGFMGVVGYVITGRAAGLTDPLVAGLVGTLIGYVSAKADQVVSYYFGSSSGSAEKNAILAKGMKG